MTRFDLADHIEVAYCVPLYVRDENVRFATAAVPGRLGDPVPPAVRGDTPIAVVCYGPTLNETWPALKGFDHIITCSGAHKFLVDRGIIPTWHIDVDPRPHKVTLMGAPHPAVEYLIASACHPDLFRHLAGMQVKLWHIFSNEQEVFRLLPAGEWALFGGSSAGLRAMSVARHLGFTRQHVFGMDGNIGGSGSHASEHPNAKAESGEVEYGGRTWKTTGSLLHCAKQTFHELNQMHDVEATFHGDGLVQAMAKDYVRVPATNESLGICKPRLITEAYRALNAQLHASVAGYGVGGEAHAAVVRKLAAATEAQSVLDYGCGKGYLAKALPFPIWEYDPAIPDKAASPRPADLVVCTDVLEHVEPELLGAVLSDLRRCVLKVGYVVISMGPARKTLADGRNTHLIQRGEAWWRKRLASHFTIGRVWVRGKKLHTVIGPRVFKKETSDADRPDPVGAEAGAPAGAA